MRERRLVFSTEWVLKETPMGFFFVFIKHGSRSEKSHISFIVSKKYHTTCYFFFTWHGLLSSFNLKKEFFYIEKRSLSQKQRLSLSSFLTTILQMSTMKAVTVALSVNRIWVLTNEWRRRLIKRIFNLNYIKYNQLPVKTCFHYNDVDQ